MISVHDAGEDGFPVGVHGVPCREVQVGAIDVDVRVVFSSFIPPTAVVSWKVAGWSHEL